MNGSYKVIYVDEDGKEQEFTDARTEEEILKGRPFISLFYHPLYEQLQLLSDEQAGKLLRAILDLDINGVILETDDKLLEMAFRSIQNQIRLSRENYIKTSRDNSINGQVSAFKRTHKDCKLTPVNER